MKKSWKLEARRVAAKEEKNWQQYQQKERPSLGPLAEGLLLLGLDREAMRRTAKK